MTKKENSTSFDWLKWLVAIALTVAAVWGNLVFFREPFLFRLLALVVVFAVVALILLQTAQGAAFMTLLQGTRTEMRKVVWPTRQETLQTTLIVLVVVAIIAVLLWLFDVMFSWLIGLLVG